jgi:hypothetical protein
MKRLSSVNSSKRPKLTRRRTKFISISRFKIKKKRYTLQQYIYIYSINFSVSVLFFMYSLRTLFWENYLHWTLKDLRYFMFVFVLGLFEFLAWHLNFNWRSTCTKLLSLMHFWMNLASSLGNYRYLRSLLVIRLCCIIFLWKFLFDFWLMSIQKLFPATSIWAYVIVFKSWAYKHYE